MMVVVILGLVALVLMTDALSWAIPQVREVIGYIQGMSFLALVMLFVLLMLGIGGTAMMRGGRR